MYSRRRGGIGIGAQAGDDGWRHIIVERDSIISAGRGRAGIADGIAGRAGWDRGDHGPQAGHSAHGNIIGTWTTVHYGRCCARRAAEGDVTWAIAKACYCFAEDDRKVDRTVAGWVGLTAGLIDRYSRWGVVNKVRLTDRGAAVEVAVAGIGRHQRSRAACGQGDITASSRDSTYTAIYTITHRQVAGRRACAWSCHGDLVIHRD